MKKIVFDKDLVRVSKTPYHHSKEIISKKHVSHFQKLFLLYYIYIIPAFVISRIAQLAVPYMLIFATLERLNWISDRRLSDYL